MAQAAFAYAAGGYHVICDGIVGPLVHRHLPQPQRSLQVIELHYVILRPDESTTLRRASARGDQALTDPEPIRSLHRQFTDLGPYEGHVLDSTHLTPRPPPAPYATA